MMKSLIMTFKLEHFIQNRGLLNIYCSYHHQQQLYVSYFYTTMPISSIFTTTSSSSRFLRAEVRGTTTQIESLS